MAPTRPFSIFKTQDQWVRATHDRTAYDTTIGAVELAWTTGDAAPVGTGVPPRAAGLAFDFWCRLYRSIPEEGRVERHLWGAQDPLKPPAAQAPPVDLFGVPEPPAVLGDFVALDPPPMFLSEPRGLAIDAQDRLYVADTKTSEVLVFDVVTMRLLRRIHLATPPDGEPGPLDAIAFGGEVLVAMEAFDELLRVDVPGQPIERKKPWIVAPSRLATPADGSYLLVLLHAGTAGAQIVFYDRPTDAFVVPYATDIEIDGTGAIVVARGPGDDFLRFQVSPGTRVDLPFMEASDYDGRGIVRTPDGKIAFFTSKGALRYAVTARLRYEKLGRVTTYVLDSGQLQTQWGRLFLDACIPESTEVRVACVAVDDIPDDPQIDWSGPKNFEIPVTRPPGSPPLPPKSLGLPPALASDGTDATFPLHKRETGREIPWARAAAGDIFETYEAPTQTGAGRFLWVTIELRGNTRVTPRVTCLRAERPGHDLLRKLPRVFSADPPVADFLRRFLAMYEGQINDLEGRAVERRVLVVPSAAPAEVLPWLAGFLGLVLDERWSADVRRTLLAELMWLFRFRGTVPGLTRFLQICLGVTPIIMEHFRLRGITLLGNEAAAPSAAIVGVGFRVGGAVGATPADAAAIVAAADPSTPDAFTTHAHRFTVIIPADLTPDEADMVANVLDVHRPAHTIYDLCYVTSGMRVGLGLYVELTSIIGRTGAFQQIQLGSAASGRGALLGRPGTGLPVGPRRVGQDSRIG